MKFTKYLLSFFLIYYFSGFIQINAQQEAACYLAVSIKNNKKKSEDSEEVLREVKIAMKYTNGIQKNWDEIAKELDHPNLKKMIEIHKKHENWDKYKEIFNKPQKYDQGTFLSKQRIENKSSINRSLIYEIGLSLISRYIAEVKPLPPSGIPSDACIYNVLVTINEEKVISTITATDLNAFGESRKKGEDGVQESILKALYNTLESKREEICSDYGSFLNQECSLFLAKKELEKSECWLEVKTDVENSAEMLDEKLVAEIVTSLISQYLVEIKFYDKTKFKNLFIEDESTTKKDREEFNKKIDKILIDNECLYKVYPKKKDDSILITLSGKGMNAYGNSKMDGADGLQQAILRALYRSLKEKRNEICNDYYNYIEKECDGFQEEITKVKEKVKEKDYRIRFYYVWNSASFSKKISNISYSLILNKYGIGQSYFEYIESDKYISNVRTLDLSYTFLIEGVIERYIKKINMFIFDILEFDNPESLLHLTTGLGIGTNNRSPFNLLPLPFIYGGESEIKKTSGTYKSKKIFGYSIFGNLGIDYGTWEVLLGYRINEFEHHDYENLAGKLNISGNHWTLGLGRGF